MSTMQNVIDLARIDLNDADKTRFTDGVLLGFLNSYIQEAIKTRPDLFVGSFLSLPEPNLIKTAIFPMPGRYERSAADYVIARASMGFTEESSMTKAGNYLNLSAKQGGI